EAGIEPSVGSVGDSYDNSMAESVIGLYKTELIRNRGPWRNLDTVEFATLTWLDWWNNRRILEPIGNIPPAEKETNYYHQNTAATTAGLTYTGLSNTRTHSVTALAPPGTTTDVPTSRPSRRSAHRESPDGATHPEIICSVHHTRTPADGWLPSWDKPL